MQINWYISTSILINVGGDMESLLKITDAASLALHTMVLLASAPDEVVTTGDIAESLRASEAHLSKVLQRLNKAGLVKSVRGPQGGFKLAKKPEAITLLDIYEAMEGPLITSTCLLGTPMCVGPICMLGSLLSTVNTEVKDYFENTQLDKLVGILCISGRSEGFDA